MLDSQHRIASTSRSGTKACRACDPAHARREPVPALPSRRIGPRRARGRTRASGEWNRAPQSAAATQAPRSSSTPETLPNGLERGDDAGPDLLLAEGRVLLRLLRARARKLAHDLSGYPLAERVGHRALRAPAEILPELPVDRARRLRREGVEPAQRAGRDGLDPGFLAEEPHLDGVSSNELVGDKRLEVGVVRAVGLRTAPPSRGSLIAWSRPRPTTKCERGEASQAHRRASIVRTDPLVGRSCRPNTVANISS